MAEYAPRSNAAGQAWPLLGELDEEQRERLLFPLEKRVEPSRPLPNGSVVHEELIRKGVTLLFLWQGLSIQLWDCEQSRAWERRLDLPMCQVHRAGEALFVDHAGQTVGVMERSTDVRISFCGEKQ